ncbi:hypothetical protein AB0M10_08840 [Streptomyces sp. NPDC051840]|uniref:hypothetical protein n=1 Tax=Streptomyces sp. NPDC051840 TaxID=3154752 RepID=UPI003414BD44
MIGTARGTGATAGDTRGFPLSRGRERLRILGRLDPGDALCDIPMVLRLRGELPEPSPRAAVLLAEIEALTEEDAEQLLAAGSGTTGAERNGTTTA